MIDSCNHKKIRENLRESYDKFASDRDASEPQDWKIVEREKFLSFLQNEGKRSLLEIGTGTGRDAKFFQDRGLKIVGIDISPVMVAFCRQKGLDVHEMDVVDIQFPDRSFDAIYAMNSLLHLSKAEFPKVLCRIHQLLKPDGVAFLGQYGGMDYENIWDKDFYTPKRFFSFYTDEKLREAVSEVFEIISFDRVNLRPKEPLHFQSLILRKRALD